MWPDILSVIAMGMLQGYLFVPILQVSVAGGEWLSRQWSQAPLPVTRAVSTLTLFAAFFWLDIVLGMELHERLAPAPALGRAGAGSFIIGAFAYVILGGLEKRLRQHQ